jgi:hypothetical protein
VDWIHLAQDRRQVEKCCEHGDETVSSIKCGESIELLSN